MDPLMHYVQYQGCDIICKFARKEKHSESVDNNSTRIDENWYAPLVLEFGQLSCAIWDLYLKCIIITIAPRSVYMWFVNLNILTQGPIVKVSFWWSVVLDCLGCQLHLCCFLPMNFSSLSTRNLIFFPENLKFDFFFNLGFHCLFINNFLLTSKYSQCAPM